MSNATTANEANIQTRFLTVPSGAIIFRPLNLPRMSLDGLKQFMSARPATPKLSSMPTNSGRKQHKSYDSALKLTKDTKNHKVRQIPLARQTQLLFIPFRKNHFNSGGSAKDRIFPISQGATDHAIKWTCLKAELPPYRCHEFRHTFISNLIKNHIPLPVIERVSGDTQQTILNRYSHMFLQDEMIVWDVLNRI